MALTTTTGTCPFCNRSPVTLYTPKGGGKPRCGKCLTRK